MSPIQRDRCIRRLHVLQEQATSHISGHNINRCRSCLPFRFQPATSHNSNHYINFKSGQNLSESKMSQKSEQNKNSPHKSSSKKDLGGILPQNFQNFESEKKNSEMKESIDKIKTNNSIYILNLKFEI